MRIALIIVLIALVLVPLIFLGAGCGAYNNLNRMHQDALGGKSHYGAALDICSQKIGGVWTVMQQHFDHESSTFQGVAQARSGYLAAQSAFQALAANPNANLKDLTQAADGALKSALSLQVQIEAYPQLQGGDIARENMRNMQEGTNEIKSALDDWIKYIKDYNTYRGSAFPEFMSTMASGFFSKFPSSLEYYEGTTGSLDMDALNPKNKTQG